MINRADYISDGDWHRILEYSRTLETPCIVINLNTVKINYNRLRGLFPYGDIYYAVKANPDKAVISMLAGMGANFDIASRPELDMVFSLGIGPERISFGNTIKKARDVA
jgi:ornithine decarboxylase